MSASAIVALLQSALLLLTMAQSTPNLSTNLQANAVSVAQQAISAATTLLAATSTVSNKNGSQTFTTPNGAVINVQGTVLTPAPQSGTSMASSCGDSQQSESSATSSDSISGAIAEIRREQAAFDASQQSTLQSELSSLTEQQGVNQLNSNVGMGGGGIAGSSVLLAQIQNDNANSIAQLKAESAAATAQGDENFEADIAELQAQQAQTDLDTKELSVQCVISQADLSAAQSAAQTSAAAQQEQLLNDMAQLATKYGVGIQPGWTMQDLVNAIAPEASLQEQFTLKEIQSQISNNNAQAALMMAEVKAMMP